MSDKAIYTLFTPAYLYMKGADGERLGEPVYIPENTQVGPGTAYDFYGDLTPSMMPQNEAARQAKKDFESRVPSASLTVKDVAAPAPSGEAPFDPADPKKDSAAEKAASEKREAEFKAREEALDKRLKDLNDREAALKKSEEASKQSAKPTSTSK